MGAGATENTITEGKLKKKREIKPRQFDVDETEVIIDTWSSGSSSLWHWGTAK